MHKVYRKAIVTLMATMATSSGDGFLFRDIRRFRAVKILYLVNIRLPKLAPSPKPEKKRAFWKLGKKTNASGSSDRRQDVIHQKINYMIICYPEFSTEPVTDSINKSTWNTRGWTFQERRLSTRMIHFCHDRIVFECRSCARAEDLGTINGGLIRDDIDEYLVSGQQQEWKQWSSIIHKYNRRELTKSSDRIKAIRGVAEAITPGMAIDYIPFAGM